MTSLALKVRIVGGLLLFIAVPYFGYLLAMTNGTDKGFGIIAGVMIATGIMLQVGSTPCVSV